MRYIRISILVLVLIVIGNSIWADFQDLSSEGKKNLRSANMHLGGDRFEKALPLYLDVVKENPYHIESLGRIAGIYFDYKHDYYEASSYFSQALAAIEKEIEDLEAQKLENPKKANKIDKEIEKFREEWERFHLLNESCWTKLFVQAQNKFMLVNDFYNLNPLTLDTADPGQVKMLNGILIRAGKDSLEAGTEQVDLNTYKVSFDSLLAVSIQDFEKLHEYAPDSTKTLKILAYAYNLLGNEEKTIETFIEVARLDPQDELVRQKLGTTFFEKEDFETAAKWFESASLVNPANPNNYYNLAITYNQLKDSEKSYENYQKVVELDPDNLDSVIQSSNLAIKLGRVDESIHYLKMAVDIQPSNLEFIRFLSYRLFQEERYDESLIYGEKWYELDSESKEAVQLAYQSAKNAGNLEKEKQYEKILNNMD
ncbi:MAG: tetratricopeptide repeat protein [Candidatus Cloacimonetes bacterium]|nr:tetratricopeptide repeat protein [Candidatus Cloacimonadota bacterium]